MFWLIYFLCIFLSMALVAFSVWHDEEISVAHVFFFFGSFVPILNFAIALVFSYVIFDSYGNKVLWSKK